MGQLSSLIAIDTNEPHPCVRLEEQLKVVTSSANMIGMDDDVLSERIRRKQARYVKAVKKFNETEVERKRLGLPTRHADGVMKHVINADPEAVLKSHSREERWGVCERCNKETCDWVSFDDATGKCKCWACFGQSA